MSRLFAIDLRSLGVFRIALATVVLADILLRACALVPHYTDDGVLLRSDLLYWFADRHRLPVSVFLAGGNAWNVACLFAIWFAAALAMLVGYRSRLATFFVWLFTVSVHLRNPYVLYGGDALVRVLLFWSFLVPVGARFSIDAWRRPVADRRERRVVSVATAGLLVQSFAVFFIAGAAKLVHPEWASGDGLLYALDHESFTTPLGAWLREQSGLARVFGVAVVAIEIAGPLLLFVPVAVERLRMVAVAAIAATLFGIAATMRVGLFPAVGLVALSPFLPGRAFASTGVTEATRVRWQGEPLRSAIAAVALAYVLVWNTGLWFDSEFRPPEPLETFGHVTFMQQKWGMFTDVPSTGWFAVEGRLDDGERVDLLARGGRLPRAAVPVAPLVRPADPSGQFPDVHWRSFFEGMARRTASEGQRLYYARYLCREWNEGRGAAPALAGLEIVYVHRPVDSSPGPKPPSAYTRTGLWVHDCFG